jgi:O-antigen/teichoic acid export membrane protein
MNLRHISYPNFRAIAGLANDSLYRTSIFMVFTNLFNTGCGFFFWMIAARLFSVEQVGLATALISALGLVILVSRLGFDSSIIRFFSLEDKGAIISTSLVVTTGASLLAGAMYIMLVEILAPSMLFLRKPEYALAFLLIGAVNSVAVMTGGAFIADRKAGRYFLQNIFLALRIPALVPLAFLGVLGIFWSVGLGYLVASIASLIMFQRTVAVVRPQVDRGFINRSFRFSFWNYVSSMLSAAPSMIIPIMVLNMLDEAEAAKYYIAFTIGSLVLIIPGSLGTSLFVEGSHGEGLRESVIRAGRAITVIMMPAVLFLLLFGDRILGLLKGEYVEAFDLLRIFALSSFPVAIYSLFVPIQSVRMKVKSIVMLNALRCLLVVGLSYVLLQRYGILGAGYAWMMTYGVIVLVVVWVAKTEGWI